MKIMRRKIDAARTTKGADETMARKFAGPLKTQREAGEAALPRQEIWDHPVAAPHGKALLNPGMNDNTMQAGQSSGELGESLGTGSLFSSKGFI
jgi:hypothetical protein